MTGCDAELREGGGTKGGKGGCIAQVWNKHAETGLRVVLRSGKGHVEASSPTASCGETIIDNLWLFQPSVFCVSL